MDIANQQKSVNLGNIDKLVNEIEGRQKFVTHLESQKDEKVRQKLNLFDLLTTTSDMDAYSAIKS